MNLVAFDQHATELHVPHNASSRHPNTIVVFVNVVCTARSKPPTALPRAPSSRIYVVVAVRSTEHSSVGFPVNVRCSRQSIAGVAAVPSHRQSVLSSLITDGERRVFGRVPQTRSTLDLIIYRHSLLALA